jgi:hypothetical protein
MRIQLTVNLESQLTMLSLSKPMLVESTLMVINNSTRLANSFIPRTIIDWSNPSVLGQHHWKHSRENSVGKESLPATSTTKAPHFLGTIFSSEVPAQYSTETEETYSVGILFNRVHNYKTLFSSAFWQWFPIYIWMSIWILFIYRHHVRPISIGIIWFGTRYVYLKRVWGCPQCCKCISCTVYSLLPLLFSLTRVTRRVTDTLGAGTDISGFRVA